MSKTRIKGKIKSNWLKANICIVIDLSNSFHHTIIKLLKFNSLCNWWNQKKWISNCIPNKWFIDEFISNDIRITLEVWSYFTPVCNEFMMYIMICVVKMVENLSNIVTCIIFGPVNTITIFRKSWWVQWYLFSCWKRKCLISLYLIN